MTPATARPARNEPCHCGSGKKYKQCHLEQDEAEARAARAAAAEAVAEPSGEAAPAAAEAAPRRVAPKRPTAQPWKRGNQPQQFRRSTTPRKVGGS
jgi:methionyl aminopeptidase